MSVYEVPGSAENDTSFEGRRLAILPNELGHLIGPKGESSTIEGSIGSEMREESESALGRPARVSTGRRAQLIPNAHSEIVGDASTVKHLARNLDTSASAAVDDHDPPPEATLRLGTDDVDGYVAHVRFVRSTSETVGDNEDGARVDGVLGGDGRGEVEADLTSIRHLNELTRVDDMVVIEFGDGAVDRSQVTAGFGGGRDEESARPSRSARTVRQSLKQQQRSQKGPSSPSPSATVLISIHNAEHRLGSSSLGQNASRLWGRIAHLDSQGVGVYHALSPYKLGHFFSTSKSEVLRFSPVTLSRSTKTRGCSWSVSCTRALNRSSPNRRRKSPSIVSVQVEGSARDRKAMKLARLFAVSKARLLGSDLSALTCKWRRKEYDKIVSSIRMLQPRSAY